MHGFAFLLLGLALSADPMELPADVHEINTRNFIIPFHFNPDARMKIEQLRLFVSVDHGKTWKHVKDCPASDDRMTFASVTDGQYWFALQVKFKDGTSDPAKTDDLVPGMKVSVNTERKALKVSEPKDELAHLKAELASLTKENRMLKEELARLKGQPHEAKKVIQPDTKTKP